MHNSPNLSDEIVNRVPRHRAVSYTPPPPHQVCRHDICMCMEMVRHRDLVVLEGRGYEPYPERLILV